MQCKACGAPAQGRIIHEMWHGLDAPGFGGFLLLAGAWWCGSPQHRIPEPGADEARYFAMRFLVPRLTPPDQGIRLVTGFVALSEEEGRQLEQDPEAIYRKQLDGLIAVETASPEDWKTLQEDVKRRDAILAAVQGLRGARG